MKQGIRQSMSALHTWGGLVFGWVLMAIFVGGTLSVFAGPISIWMSGVPVRPEQLRPQTAAEALHAVDIGIGHLQREAPGTRKFQFYTPENYVGWTDAAGTQHEVRLDPATGREKTKSADSAANPRETAGGGHFVGLHFSLHAGMAGIVLVGFVTVALLVALVSGIIIHKRIFKDFFTLRLGKGQRSWLDGHNVASVLTLPFQLMIAYTGLVIFLAVWMPSSAWYHYGMPEGLQGELDWTSPFVKARAAEGYARPPAIGDDLSLATVPALAREASRRTGQPLSQILVTDERRLIFIPADGPTLEASGSPARLDPHNREPSRVDEVQEVMVGLHEVHYGGETGRWLWFLSGLAGCVMIATGLNLFTAKRRQRSGEEFGKVTPTVYRVIEALNVASIAGILLASIAFFWANRIIPAAAEGRAETEVLAFLLIWAATPLHALLRPGRNAWVEQIGLGAILCLTLPALNLATTGDWLGRYLARGDWSAGGVEIFALIAGAALAAAAIRLAQKPA